MLDRIINSIAVRLAALESKWGMMRTSFLLGTLLFAIAMLYVQPIFTVAFHGIPFSDLSAHPFDFSLDNPMRYRILSPFLAYLLFLRGDNFFIFPLLVTWLFACITYARFRKQGLEPVDGFLLSCFIAFSCVLLLPLVAPAYTDATTWLLVFLAFTCGKKTGWSAFLFSLALLNHESAFVLLPALTLFNYEQRQHSFLKIVLLFLAACVPHLAYRWYVHAHSVTRYSLSFYLSKETMLFSFHKLILFFPVAAFYAFKLWWLFPVTSSASALVNKKYMRFSILFLLISGVFSLSLISYDYTRMVVISFPAVLLSYQWFLEKSYRETLRKFTFALILLNFIILQYHFNYDGAQPMFPWLLNKISAHFGMLLT
jgi:hypothetical protein